MAATCTVIEREPLMRCRSVIMSVLSDGTSAVVPTGLVTVKFAAVETVDDTTTDPENVLVVLNSNNGTAGSAMGSIYLNAVTNAKTYTVLAIGF